MKLSASIPQFLKRIDIVEAQYAKLVMARVHRLRKHARNQGEFVRELITNPRFARIRPAQIYDELLRFSELVQSMNPKLVLEIGSAHGGTLVALTQVCSDDAHLITVDIPTELGGCQSWRDKLYPMFAVEQQRVTFIRGDSHTSECQNQIESYLEDNRIDVLFIDGDHSAEGVAKDFSDYRRFVNKGGVIAFHDIVSGPVEFVGGVPEFWRTIKEQHRHLEIVKDEHQQGYGIGGG